jgi:hypothetical protein
LAKNIKGLRSGFTKNHSEGTMMLGVNGYTQLIFDGVYGGIITFPPYVSGQEAFWECTEQPDVYHVDQTQKWPLGTRYQKGERSFRYTKLGALVGGWSSYFGAQGLGLISKNTITDVTIVTATDGANTVTGAATATANQFAGGYLSLYGTGTDEAERGYMITANTATTASNVVFTIDGTLDGTYDASDKCAVLLPTYAECIPSGKTGGRGSSVSFEAFVGILIASEDKDGTAAAAGDFTWLQTWGPYPTWASVSYGGATAQERNVYFMGLGDMQVADPAGSYNRFWCQQAGFLLPCTGATPGTSTSGTDSNHYNQWVFLQITP